METLEELKTKIVESKRELQKHVLFEFSRIVEGLYERHSDLAPLWVAVYHNGDFLSYRVYKSPGMERWTRFPWNKIEENVVYNEICNLFGLLTESVLEDSFEGDFEVSKNGVKQL